MMQNHGSNWWDPQLKELMGKNGNHICADCDASNPDWASHNLGIFICYDCSGIHRSLGVHISKVKSVTLDRWDESEIKLMAEMGNDRARGKYEQFLPACYRRPKRTHALVLKEQWIRAKYERLEFIEVDKQTYLSPTKEGYLWKRGKDDNKFLLRKFILSEKDNSLRYYVKEDAKEPKACLNLDSMNATFVAEKIGNLNGVQITYDCDGCTRNLFVYTDEGKDIVDWFMAIRSAKLNRRQIAFPIATIDQLTESLTRDFTLEGWLMKTGPKPNAAFRKRWFTLDRRKLLYFADPLDAFAKGEIFIGHSDNEYGVKTGAPPGRTTQVRTDLNHYKQALTLRKTFGEYNLCDGFCFTLITPNRQFVFSAETETEQQQWTSAIKKVINTDLSPQDSNAGCIMMRKKRATSMLSPFKIG